MHDPNQHRRQPEATDPVAVAWYRVPLVWFALLLFACMLAACIHLIVLSSRHVDLELAHGERVFRVPAAAVAPDPSPSDIPSP